RCRNCQRQSFHSCALVVGKKRLRKARARGLITNCLDVGWHGCRRRGGGCVCCTILLPLYKGTRTGPVSVLETRPFFGSLCKASVTQSAMWRGVLCPRLWWPLGYNPTEISTGLMRRSFAEWILR